MARVKKNEINERKASKVKYADEEPPLVTNKKKKTESERGALYDFCCAGAAQ